MPRYRIAYIDGETETVTADVVEPDGFQYTAHRNRKIVAHIPAANVRSIVRQDDDQDVNS